jgi:hypothetical protein
MLILVSGRGFNGHQKSFDQITITGQHQTLFLWLKITIIVTNLSYLHICIYENSHSSIEIETQNKHDQIRREKDIFFTFKPKC